MTEKYLYLAIDGITIVFPFMLSFYSKDKFYRKWKYLWIAILLPGSLFVGWDMLFTRLGVWGFNPRYVVGVYCFNLPIEEVLFFLCIPYACCFTYDVVNRIPFKTTGTWIEYRISNLLGGSLIVIGALNYYRLHTTVTFLLAGTLLLLLRWVLKATFLGKFYRAFGFFALPFLVINGILSGSRIDEPVVWYNDSEILGIKIGSIPVEDIIYGMTLILLNVAILEYVTDFRSQKPEVRRELS